jgi:hypothetical protein
MNITCRSISASNNPISAMSLSSVCPGTKPTIDIFTTYRLASRTAKNCRWSQPLCTSHRLLQGLATHLVKARSIFCTHARGVARRVQSLGLARDCFSSQIRTLFWFIPCCLNTVPFEWPQAWVNVVAKVRVCLGRRGSRGFFCHELRRSRTDECHLVLVRPHPAVVRHAASPRVATSSS